MADLFSLRRASARNRFGGLARELDRWVARTTDEKAWRRHQTQVARITAVIAGLIGPIPDELAALAPDPAGWRQLARLERRILAANSIWDLFRSKLVLRSHADLGPVLRFADDFAWACYGPMRQACAPGGSRREPPLVYFSDSWSPFALGRNSDFTHELRVGDSEVAAAIQDTAFVETLERLPVPLISIPWFMVGHLPGMLIVAHEVGHVVSWDFGLGAALAAGIDAADWQAGRETWQRWREEVFADLFAVVVGGGDFAAALMDLLAVEPDIVAKEASLRRPHPPRSLRVEIVLRAVARSDAARAAVLRERWQASYAERPALPDAEADIDAIVDLVLQLDCGGRPLSTVFPAMADEQTYLLQRCRSGQTSLGKDSFDPRPALAAAQSVHEGRRLADETDATRAEVQACLLGFVDQVETGYRGNADVARPMIADATAADRALGLALQGLIDDRDLRL